MLDTYEFGGYAELLDEEGEPMRNEPISFVIVLADSASAYYISGARKAVCQMIVDRMSGDNLHEGCN